jgi:hypothetical protein
MDLENDDFFDPGIQSVIILDDLMSTAAKDSRFKDLFTEGSHHRNLTTIALDQNMYFGKDPTQSCIPGSKKSSFSRSIGIPRRNSTRGTS